MAVPGEIEVIELAATFGLQEDCTILSFDGTNTFNSICRHRMLPVLADVTPVATHYAANIYVLEPMKLLFDMEGPVIEVIPSAHAIQKGCNPGSPCDGVCFLKTLMEFKTNLPMPEAQVLSFIDDIMLILPPERASPGRHSNRQGQVVIPRTPGSRRGAA